jgi:hypothetical protein
MNSNMVIESESMTKDEEIKLLISKIDSHFAMELPEHLEEFRNCIILDAIAELAYLDHNSAYNLLKKVNTSSIYLKDSVLWMIQSMISASVPNEFDLHKKFFSNLDKLIPNAKVVNEDVIKEHRPDGFLEINGELHVVEMKLKVFDVSALKQICRYMRNYTAKGVAVAPKLSCSLPDDVMFVELSV